MTQTIILAPGSTETTSPDIVVPAGAVACIGMYVAADVLPKEHYRLRVQHKTPGIPNHVASLSAELPSVVVQGPATYNVYRPAGAVQVGVFYDL